MSQYQATATKIINAPTDRVYAIISDYVEGHPSILPARYVTGMTVTEGGQGEGTSAIIEMKVLGTSMVFHVDVTEPEPGRVLVEEDKSSGAVTTFTFLPVNGGEQTRVTISTEGRNSPGLRGLVERVLTPAILRRVYREELDQLAEVVQAKDQKWQRPGAGG